MKYSTLSLVILLLGVLVSCRPDNKSAENKKEKLDRSNVLFLFADDQRADAMGCSGNTYIKTPNIDKLADNGIRFTNSYVMGGHHAAICAPSRAMLMSGKSIYHVYENFDMVKWNENIVLDGVTTMPMYFAQYGYETFGTGKWHNGGKSFEASFQKGENARG